MKKLTVITVTYNAEHTIERTLKSVFEQSYPHIEHIIMDGASTDQTVSIIEKSTCRVQAFNCVSEPDKGIYDAMNKATAIASGDYLCYLNAGDTFFSTDTVEKMMRCVESEDQIDILYGETAIVDDNGSFLCMRRLKTPQSLTWRSFKQGMVVCHQAFIIRREIVEPYDLSYRFSSDFDWCIRMMKKADCIYNSQLTLINYLHEGITTANRKASLKERYHIMVKYYGAISTFFSHGWFVLRALIK